MPLRVTTRGASGEVGDPNQPSWGWLGEARGVGWVIQGVVHAAPPVETGATGGPLEGCWGNCSNRLEPSPSAPWGSPHRAEAAHPDPGEKVKDAAKRPDRGRKVG